MPKQNKKVDQGTKLTFSGTTYGICQIDFSDVDLDAFDEDTPVYDVISQLGEIACGRHFEGGSVLVRRGTGQEKEYSTDDLTIKKDYKERTTKTKLTDGFYCDYIEIGKGRFGEIFLEGISVFEPTKLILIQSRTDHTVNGEEYYYFESILYDGRAYEIDRSQTDVRGKGSQVILSRVRKGKIKNILIIFSF